MLVSPRYHRCTCTNMAMIDLSSPPCPRGRPIRHQRQTQRICKTSCLIHFRYGVFDPWIGITYSQKPNNIGNGSILQFHAGSVNGLQSATDAEESAFCHQCNRRCSFIHNFANPVDVNRPPRSVILNLCALLGLKIAAKTIGLLLGNEKREQWASNH